MRAHSSINLSQTLYDALRAGYLNSRSLPVAKPVPRDLPDIAGIVAQPKPEETALGQ